MIRRRWNGQLVRGAWCLGMMAALPFAAGANSAPRAQWVGSWSSAQMLPDPRNALASSDLADVTLRQAIRVTGGGARIRLRLSNTFGTAPLAIDSVHLARATRADAPDNVPSTDRTVQFDGATEVVIPPGAEYWSDPVDFATSPLATLHVSFHLQDAPDRQTGHSASHAMSFVVPGNHAADIDLPDAKRFEHWAHLSGVAVAGGDTQAALVAFGDSITDGSGSTTNANNRWPDVLAERFRSNPRTKGITVLNAGIGGNRVLLDGAGPNALSRFDRDVLGQPGVRFLVILEGINDIGTLTRQGPVGGAAHANLVKRLTSAYAQMIDRAHQHGIKVFMATLPPFMGALSYHPDSAGEADREAVNMWIRTSGHGNAVIDFDRAVRDPAHPERLLPQFDSGDHLHPSPSGYRAMGQAISLALLRHGLPQ